MGGQESPLWVGLLLPLPRSDAYDLHRGGDATMQTYFLDIVVVLLIGELRRAVAVLDKEGTAVVV